MRKRIGMRHALCPPRTLCASPPADDLRRVEVFFAGVQKGATTTLHRYLAAHPAMSPPDGKEPHHFDDETRDWRDGDGHATLASCYAAGDAGRLRYDATPIYGFWPTALLRIRAYNPRARLIWIFRDPVARAWSHWRMERARGWETLPFAQAIREGRRRMDPATPLSPAHRIHSYVERGYYGRQVADALDLFPRAQMLFLTTRDLHAHRDATLARVAAFLDIAPFAPVTPVYAHVGSPVDAFGREQPSPADRAYLRDLWRGDGALLTHLTGIETREWR